MPIVRHTCLLRLLARCRLLDRQVQRRQRIASGYVRQMERIVSRLRIYLSVPLVRHTRLLRLFAAIRIVHGEIQYHYGAVSAGRIYRIDIYPALRIFLSVVPDTIASYFGIGILRSRVNGQVQTVDRVRTLLVVIRDVIHACLLIDRSTPFIRIPSRHCRLLDLRDTSVFLFRCRRSECHRSAIGRVETHINKPVCIHILRPFGYLTRRNRVRSASRNTLILDHMHVRRVVHVRTRIADIHRTFGGSLPTQRQIASYPFRIVQSVVRCRTSLHAVRLSRFQTDNLIHTVRRSPQRRSDCRTRCGLKTDIQVSLLRTRPKRGHITLKQT